MGGHSRSLASPRPALPEPTLAVSDFWVPIPELPPLLRAVHIAACSWLVANGRLKPGVTLSQARDEIMRISRDLEREYPRTTANAASR